MVKLKLDKLLVNCAKNKKIRYGLLAFHGDSLMASQDSLINFLLVMAKAGFPLAKISEGILERPMTENEIIEVASSQFDVHKPLGESGLVSNFFYFLWLEVNGKPIPRVNFSIEWYSGKHENEIGVNLSLEEQPMELWNGIAEKMIELGKIIYAVAKAEYICIDNITEVVPEISNIQNLELHVFWSNFFGPEYVKKYDKKYFLNAPGYIKEELADGGIYYQISEKFTDHFKNPFSDSRIKDHFTKAKFARY